MLVDSDWKRVALPLLIAVLALGGCAGQDKSAGSSASSTEQQDSSASSVNKESISSMLDDYEKTRGKRAESLVMPNSVADGLRLAEKSVREEEFANAIKYASFVISRRPDLAEAYRLRGKSEFESTDSAAGQKDLERAATLDPTNFDTFETLASLYVSGAQPERGLIAINQAIKLRPTENRLYEFRAALYQQLGRDNDALGDLNKSVELHPKKWIGYAKRGKFFEAIGKQSEALADYTKAVELKEASSGGEFQLAELLKVRATLLSKLGRHEEAIKDLDTAMETVEADDDALRMRGKEYAFLKDYEKAIADYTAAIDQSPEFARASYEARSALYAKLGKDDLAAQDRKKAATLKNKPAEKVIFDTH